VGSKDICTDFAQIPQRSRREVKFPVKIEYKGQRAKIYRPAKGFPFYRISFRMAGKRHMETFGTYGEAEDAANKKVREIHNGQMSGGLTAKQSQDATVAFEQLQDYYKTTGRRVSLISAVGTFVDSSRKLGEHTFDEAIEGFLQTTATLKRVNVDVAVEEYIKSKQPHTISAEGKRPKLSPKYIYNLSIQLRRFAATFPNTAVCDLTKEHIDAFIQSLYSLKTKSGKNRAANSGKSRNHYRIAIRQLLRWAVRKDYLSAKHRLGEADGLVSDDANSAKVSIYTPGEFASLLNNASKDLRPMIAVGGLAGLRASEMLRLDWADVWRKRGNIDISGEMDKNRQMRTVEICPALQKWLKPFRDKKSGKLWQGNERKYQRLFSKLCRNINITRKNNALRHSYCSYHLKLHSNESFTAEQAGNSPAIIHSNYKSAITKAEAEKWFKVVPKKSDK
jgi:integrase